MESVYEQQALREALRYEKSLQRRASIIKRSTKKIQTKVNQKIPNRIHTIVTESIKKMIELALTTSSYIRVIDVNQAWRLEERESVIRERIKQYKQTAMLEGAGTGAGGLWLGAADFPLLLSIKMKLLFDIGQIYGYNVKDYQERMYLLHVFMLAFSSEEKQREVMQILNNWEKEQRLWKEVDWKTLQLEYRDTIDFVKMLQLIPGFGAVVGAIVNRQLLDQLGEAAMNMYRLRLLKK
ncbi:EcsC family protein [Aquibacillus albus]|uniref:Uncharacterized protein (DUF697 family) n=1 Tax=Aquibacillus albus TaxID=1168171 RepID=A0ABS2N084_9BACI|nr:EcsC family protein [Aquibacillus albus]MBM7571458.1 uncharacterized protein (DUF697 family) [Aquibacillus albus]